jgi:hypothetical protein
LRDTRGCLVFAGRIMNLQDYLLNQSGKNWQRLLQDWIPPLPASFTLWLVNRFGDLFIVTPDGAVHLLDVTAGTLTQLASSREDFARLLDTGDNAAKLLQIPLVDACHRIGMALAPHQCLGLKVPPILGGRYELANVAPTDVSVHYSYLAYLHKQEDIYWMPTG